MAVIKTRTSNRIEFTFYVIQDIGPDGTEYAFDIADDGWSIRIRTEGRLVEQIRCAEDRRADKSSAAFFLGQWAVQRWGAENTDAHIPSE